MLRPRCQAAGGWCLGQGGDWGCFGGFPEKLESEWSTTGPGVVSGRPEGMER
jgi:hypothetical protein